MIVARRYLVSWQCDVVASVYFPEMHGLDYCCIYKHVVLCGGHTDDAHATTCGGPAEPANALRYDDGVAGRLDMGDLSHVSLGQTWQHDITASDTQPTTSQETTPSSNIRRAGQSTARPTR